MFKGKPRNSNWVEINVTVQCFKQWKPQGSNMVRECQMSFHSSESLPLLLLKMEPFSLASYHINLILIKFFGNIFPPTFSFAVTVVHSSDLQMDTSNFMSLWQHTLAYINNRSENTQLPNTKLMFDNRTYVAIFHKSFNASSLLMPTRWQLSIGGN